MIRKSSAVYYSKETNGMQKQKLSGPAIFMYSMIALTAILSVVFFYLYYSGISDSQAVL